MTQQTHVIFGTGPVGCWTARALRGMNVPVRAVNRSGNRPKLMPADVDIIAADISDPRQAIEAADNAAAVYQALNPPYQQWHAYFPVLQTNAMAAAKTAGARYISIENLYMYDSSQPITETSALCPCAKKGELRRKMSEEVMVAHQRGEIRATALRPSDYYGPGVLNSAFGEMIFGRLVAGKKAQVIGSARMPHTVAYIEDVGKAAALLGTREESLGQAWIAPHTPALTQGEMVEMACQILKMEPRISVLSPFMMRLAGLFVPEARASVEMMYEFTAPFVVDSKKFEQTFQVKATPVEEGVRKTVAWYQAQPGSN